MNILVAAELANLKIFYVPCSGRIFWVLKLHCWRERKVVDNAVGPGNGTWCLKWSVLCCPSGAAKKSCGLWGQPHAYGHLCLPRSMESSPFLYSIALFSNGARKNHFLTGFKMSHGFFGIGILGGARVGIKVKWSLKKQHVLIFPNLCDWRSFLKCCWKFLCWI